MYSYNKFATSYVRINIYPTFGLDGLIVPYRSIYEEPRSFKTPGRVCFIPGKPVTVKIIDVERDRVVSSNLLNPNLYVIQVTHANHTWIVKRRYKHFQNLHQQLQIYRLVKSIFGDLHTAEPKLTDEFISLESHFTFHFHQKRTESVGILTKPHYPKMKREKLRGSPNSPEDQMPLCLLIISQREGSFWKNTYKI